MRIVDVSPRVVNPVRFGSSVRTANLLARLSRHHEVRQLSQAGWRKPGGTTWPTPSWCEERFASPLASLTAELGVWAWPTAPVLSGAGLRLARPRRLRELLTWSDVALIEFPWQFEACRRLRADLYMVLDAHNVEAIKFRSFARAAGVGPRRARRWLRIIDRAERAAVQRADLILAVSAPERDVFIERYGAPPERVLLVPNGPNTGRGGPAGPAARAAARARLGLDGQPVVLYAGSNVQPNRAGLRWIERVAARLPDMTFLVVGEVAPEGRTANVVATGYIDDFALCLSAADLAVCPIEHGAGTSIKLLSALAAGLPTITFSDALHGLDARDEEHLLVTRKSEAALMGALRRVAEDPALSARLGQAGRAFVQRHHDWDRIADGLEEALIRLVTSGPSRR